MFLKSFSFTIIILALSLTFVCSTYLSEDALIEKDDIGTFFCRDGKDPNLYCCPLLSHRLSSQHDKRCVTIVLNNKSGYDITLAVANLENGEWVNDYNISCEPQTEPLANKKSQAFSSITSYKMQGLATFIVNDDSSSVFTISWKAPVTNSDDYFSYSLVGKKYNVDFQFGLEDTVLQATVYKAPFYQTIILPSIWIVTTVIAFISLLFCCLTCGKVNDLSKTHINSRAHHSYNTV
ncbi:626_t:CDS:1 [Cetraspora pellucida]|uniref:626_t:CDS:1 n=1 Tax=Cetraspora pellucida TaxID=1433469 RepID=A0A9N9EIC6_9GLOM|nr:626_t:CDS:1 [Cetraspora pellucida]